MNFASTLIHLGRLAIVALLGLALLKCSFGKSASSPGSTRSGGSGGGSFGTLTATVNGKVTTFGAHAAYDCNFISAQQNSPGAALVSIDAFAGAGDTGASVVIAVQSNSLPAAVTNVMCAQTGQVGTITYTDEFGDVWVASNCTTFDSGAFSASVASTWSGSAASTTMILTDGSGTLTLSNIAWSCSLPTPTQ